MALKPVVDSLDDVDEAFRSEYLEFDDNGTKRFKLDVETFRAHPDAVALANALDRQKRRVTELNGEVGTLKSKLDVVPDDFDPELYDRAVKEGVGGGGKLPNEDEIRKQAAEAAKKAAETEFDKERKKLSDERDRLKARVERDVRVNALNEALAKEGVTDPVYLKAARAIIGEGVSVKWDEDSGDFVAVAHDDDLGDIPVAERVKSWAATDEGKAFVGARGSGGGGANGGGNQGGNPPKSSDRNPFKPDTINVSEQARLRRENPEQARKLARDAGLQPTW